MKEGKRVLVSFIWAVVMCSLLLPGCSGEKGALSPEEIIRDARLDLLRDETFIFPSNRTEEGDPEYLPLRKWDIIFVGRMKPGYITGLDPNVASLFIPGDYDHILVYVGKDMQGYAYAVELNTDSIRLSGGEGIVVGGIRFLCIGKDYGEDPHPSGGQVLDRALFGVRWARTFYPDDRQRLKAADGILTERIRGDILGNYPYQLEFRLRGTSFLVGRTIELVDDGLANGAGCGDYWTNIFEDYAGVCVKGARKTAQEIMDYYMHDPVGKTAYIPDYLNPFGGGDIPVTSLFALGFQIVDDKPHRFSCDGTEETGLVLPDAVFRSASLADITPVLP